MPDAKASDDDQTKSHDDGEFLIRVVNSFNAIDPDQWAKLKGTTRGSEKDAPYNPFVSHGFLSALEAAGCATAQTGWLGQHLLLQTTGDELLGALPCYLKGHSQGEYVFDHAWADAFERAGGNYYPKLQSSVPFTPATGPRLLFTDDMIAASTRTALAQGLTTLTDKNGLSSAHATFVPDNEIDIFSSCGYLVRTDQQFHFHNDGYGAYDDFLGTLASRKRKALKKERRVALENDISIDWLSGSDLTEAVWDTFFDFYMDTGSRKWGRPYLTREFFSLISEAMADDILLIMASRGSRYIAGAINFIGSDTLYGRHWGCIEDHRFLHFEVCYHQAIDFAIEKGLKTVEAGAQGEHKLSRGYMPVTTHSAHYIAHPGLRRAVADYLGHERADVERISQLLHDHGPFRKG
ncbi:GNAT family N-acetyltransferase [Hoeflea prorocentri]|uniref:GNAT family N-acetyltransferase n=1 Tax=Hoeflea prorocentri TaxID=1922333 RepID=A0A9X3ZGN2_9HYPH|nr:GNAT family N-acetyltransferase [Hoeflea prorocentri]MCY6380952.1 GNAT family N-acetyltransferase [Hoeflea prorocentri]MDA5398752.1 GNAT family N-acetyltransferase [Hoeflea prorocentri]